MDVSFDEDDVDDVVLAIVDMPETCSLDVAEQGEHTFEELSDLLRLDVKEVFRFVQLAQEKVTILLADEHPDDPYFRVALDHEMRNPKDDG